MAGTVIINVFGISLPGVRIAGGILVGRVAFRMLYPKDRRADPRRGKESRDKADISFFPLAMPSLSGPGSIAATLSLAIIVEHWWQYVAISIGILVIAMIVFATLRLSGKLTRFLGVNGTNAMTKIMGFIIFCIAVQFIVNGVTDPSLIAKFREVPETVCP